MKVLIIQENGHHKKNRDFRECFSLQRAFKYHDHEADVWGNLHNNYNTIPDFNSYDIIINLENYSLGWIPDLSNVTNPYKIVWSIDAHCRGTQVYEDMFASGKYNLLLHSTRDFVKGKHSAWFPNAYDDDLICRRSDVDKQHFIGFCGNYVNRKHLLDRIAQKYDMKSDIFVIGDDMVNAINSYRIHFNKNMSNDINYRSFETLGAGTALITNYNEQYSALGFEEDKNCFMYKNDSELFDRLEYLQNNPKLVARVSDSGMEFAKKHTYKVRVKSLLTFLQNVL